MKQEPIREAVGVFGDRKSLDAAVEELELTAFPRHHISVLGGKNAIEKTFGTDSVAPEKAEDNPDAPRAAPIMPEERALGAAILVGVLAYIGGCATAITANAYNDVALLLAIATGSILGGLLGGIGVALLGKMSKKNIDKQIKKGGLILWVQTTKPKMEKVACDILKKHGGHNVHVHNIN